MTWMIKLGPAGGRGVIFHDLSTAAHLFRLRFYENKSYYYMSNYVSHSNTHMCVERAPKRKE